MPHFKNIRTLPFGAEMSLTLVLLAPITLAAVLANYIAPYDPLRTGVGSALQSPSWTYPMGTDQVGGDIFSQVVYGSRVAIYVTVASTTLALVVALIVGLLAGYRRGLIDEILMRATDVFLSIPSFVLIIFVVILYGSRIEVITLVIGAVSWPTMARIIRAQVLTVKEREFVLAARALGAGSFNLMFDEILPNIWLPLIPVITLQMGAAVLTEVGLSFLGLGDPNTMSWGRTLGLASRSIYLGTWWSVLMPGLAVVAAILGFNLLGDTMSRATNRRQMPS